MAVDAFLKLDGVTGESSNNKYKGEIEVLSFSWGVSNAGTSGSGGGGGAGKASIHDFSIMKYIDTASPQLFQLCACGQHLSGGLFTLTDKGTNLGYYKVIFTDVLISSVQPGGSAGGNAPMEQVSFQFATAEISAANNQGQVSPPASCSITTSPT